MALRDDRGQDFIWHGKAGAERFDNAVRKKFTVSKEEMQRRESEWQKKQIKKAEN